VRIGILQPSYLPWLGYFEQISRCDVFVFYDDVQYDRDGWRNRNRIKTRTGPQWLTVPIFLKFEDHPQLHRIKIDNSRPWRKKHLLSIEQNYAKAPFFRDYWGMFREVYDREWEYLADLNIHFTRLLTDCLGIRDKKFARSSELNIPGDRIDRLIAICRSFEADVFYEGAAGRNYIPEKEFLDHGIRVEFQDYAHPVYRQQYGPFVPFLSVIDLLFNNGRDSLEILSHPPTKKERP
jgi:hypothetical protein